MFLFIFKILLKSPFQGFKYIYLTPDDYAKVASFNSVKTVLIEDEGESRYKITDIIGKLLFQDSVSK